MSLKSLGCALVIALAWAGSAHASTTWLCRPGLAHDPCAPGLETTRASATGAELGTFTPRATRRRVDCFYVYPTVSDQPTAVATRRIDPEERSIALYQAARYSSLCRVFAPMYRQVTLAALFGAATTNADRALGYRDVAAAWHDYLRHYNHGRGVVLIGHSQGSFVLRRLIARHIDGRPAARRLVSAVLLGGNVTVKAGSDRGGDFKHIRACRSSAQLGCVIAFSTYGATPPANALFGRPPAAGLEVLCTNPAALGGGSGRLDTILPSAPFAPGSSLGRITPGIGYPAVQASTPWIEFDGVYRASCSDAGGADVLRISPAATGAPTLKALPDATWGLHLADANIALGNLVRVVERQARAYARAH